MILIDISVLVSAYNRGDSRHKAARSWFEEIMSTGRPAFCWETINGFVRVCTNKRAVPNPYSLAEAFDIVKGWLAAPNSSVLEPTAGHLAILESISIDANANGPLYSDAVLAAYAISHNTRLASADRDFRLFDGLRLIDPLKD